MVVKLKIKKGFVQMEKERRLIESFLEKYGTLVDDEKPYDITITVDDDFCHTIAFIGCYSGNKKVIEKVL